jgi:hypothetical protein
MVQQIKNAELSLARKTKKKLFKVANTVLKSKE